MALERLYADAAPNGCGGANELRKLLAPALSGRNVREPCSTYRGEAAVHASLTIVTRHSFTKWRQRLIAMGVLR